MAQIAIEDYPNKLIYLHIDTVTSGFDPALMQKEHRTLRRLNANGERKFDPMVTFVGNESKGGGNFTPPSTRLRAGVKIVPYDTGTGTQYSLPILNEILNIPDGLADRAVFDRSTVVANVDVDKGYDPVEVKTVSSGSGLSQAEHDQLMDLSTSNLDVLVSTRLAAVDYLAPDNQGIIDMEAKIDLMIADVIDILKLTGYKVTKSGTVITIYEANGVDVWRQYDLINDGRVQV